MKPLRVVNYLWPAFVSMMVLSAIVASLPAVLANDTVVTTVEDVEPLQTSTGNWQDLQGIEETDTEQWSWDLENNDGIISENVQYEITPELIEKSPTIDPEKEDEDWQNSHRGDPKKSGGTIPFAEF
ncbi:MAG: hypothetical protein QNJ64_19510 [Crocosphaera sp.]|nr:hypothetical protein [Crocosphaera sp.]